MLSNRLLWPGMVGIALAVGLGVQMGESAIGAIDPIHFQGPAPPVQAADPNAAPPPQSAYASAYGWEQGEAARQADGAFWSAGQDFDYVPQPELRQASAPAQLPPAPVNLAPWRPGQVSSHPDVERYTDYPIEEKPVVRPAPEPAEAAPEAAEAPADPAGK